MTTPDRQFIASYILADHSFSGARLMGLSISAFENGVRLPMRFTSALWPDVDLNNVKGYNPDYLRDELFNAPRFSGVADALETFLGDNPLIWAYDAQGFAQALRSEMEMCGRQFSFQTLCLKSVGDKLNNTSGASSPNINHRLNRIFSNDLHATLDVKLKASERLLGEDIWPKLNKNAGLFAGYGLPTQSGLLYLEDFQNIDRSKPYAKPFYTVEERSGTNVKRLSEMAQHDQNCSKTLLDYFSGTLLPHQSNLLLKNPLFNDKTPAIPITGQLPPDLITRMPQAAARPSQVKDVVSAPETHVNETVPIQSETKVVPVASGPTSPIPTSSPSRSKDKTNPITSADLLSNFQRAATQPQNDMGIIDEGDFVPSDVPPNCPPDGPSAAKPPSQDHTRPSAQSRQTNKKHAQSKSSPKSAHHAKDQNTASTGRQDWKNCNPDYTFSDTANFLPAGRTPVKMADDPRIRFYKKPENIPRSGEKWSRQELEALTAMFLEGANMLDMMFEFGRSPAAILLKLHAHGVVDDIPYSKKGLKNAEGKKSEPGPAP